MKNDKNKKAVECSLNKDQSIGSRVQLETLILFGIVLLLVLHWRGFDYRKNFES